MQSYLERSRTSLYLLFFCAPFFALAAPPFEVPAELRKQFTLDETIPIGNQYFDNTYIEPKVYTREMYNTFIEKAKKRECNYYGETDLFLYQALDEMKSELKDKEVCLIGSDTPWYESILLSYGARPVVIEYNRIWTNDPRVTYFSPSQFSRNPRKFDLILSISSTEHDGLGRYGDPIDPEGDLKAMSSFKKMLSPKGKLLIAVPVGLDILVWNAHRIYGRKRLPLLFRNWVQLKSYGFNEARLDGTLGAVFQPLFLLTAD